MAQGALHQAFRRWSAVFFQQMLFRGAGVDPDADRNAVPLRAVRHQANPFFPADVAGVDPHLGDPVLHGLDGQPVVKMNVRHQRYGASVHQRPNRLRAGLVIHADPHQVAAGRGQRANLGQGRFHVPGVRIRHGLHQHRMPAAQQKIAYLNRPGHFLRFLSVLRSPFSGPKSLPGSAHLSRFMTSFTVRTAISPSSSTIPAM